MVELPGFLFRFNILLCDNKHRMIRNIAYLLINSSKRFLGGVLTSAQVLKLIKKCKEG